MYFCLFITLFLFLWIRIKVSKYQYKYSNSLCTHAHIFILTALLIIICGTSTVSPDCVKLSCYSSHLGKKNQKKAPKRVHKAEREKLKREHLNELFLGLANALGNVMNATY